MQGYVGFAVLVMLIWLFTKGPSTPDLPYRPQTHQATRAATPTPPRPTASTGYDPVNRPSDVVAVINDVSAATGTPTGILYGLWRSESSEVYGDRGGAGGANVLEQYAIRRHWGAGNADANEKALRIIAQRSGWNAETVQGSRGKSTMDVNAHDFGGCIGPMQITPIEWLEDPAVADHDPLNLYWAVYSAGLRLKRDHDRWVATGKTDQEGWSIAIRDYAGNRDGATAWGYYANKIVPRWREWSTWKKEGDLVRNVSAVAEYSGRKYRATYASR